MKAPGSKPFRAVEASDAPIPKPRPRAAHDAAHDAEVAAKALDEAAEDVAKNGIQMNGSSTRWTTQHSLRSRAQAIRDGQETV